MSFIYYELENHSRNLPQNKFALIRDNL